MSKAKGLRLSIPPDVYNILLREQANRKMTIGGQFSLEQTIFMIVRKWGNLNKPTNQ